MAIASIGRVLDEENRVQIAWNQPKHSSSYSGSGALGADAVFGFDQQTDDFLLGRRKYIFLELVGALFLGSGIRRKRGSKGVFIAFH